MINERVLLNLPLEFEKGIKIYPPTVKDVVGNEYFGVYRKLLMSSQEEIEDELVEKGNDQVLPTPLEFLLANVAHNREVELIAKSAFEFFVHDKVTFLPKQKIIIVGDLGKTLSNVNDVSELPMLNEDNFLVFQNLLRLSLGEKEVESPNPNEDPRIKRMKAKARYRDKIKAKKNNGTTLGTILTAICCMGLGLTPLNIGEISYASVSAIVNTYQSKEKYEIDLKSMIAGAKGIKLQYWIGN